MAESEIQTSISVAQQNTNADAPTINPNNSCRLCLSNDDIFSVFNNGKLYDNDKNLCSIISQCVAVKISSNDGLSDFICQKCFSKINSWHDFKTICFSTQLKLNEWLSKTSSSTADKNKPDVEKDTPSTAQLHQPIQVKQEPVEVPIEEEDDDDQVDDLNIIIQNPTNELIESPSTCVTTTQHPSDVNPELPRNSHGNDEDVLDYDDVNDTIHQDNEDNESVQIASAATDYTPLLLAHQIKKEPRVVLEELADQMLQNNAEVDYEDDEDYFGGMDSMEMEVEPELEPEQQLLEPEQEKDYDELSCPVCFNRFDTTDLVMQHLCNQDCKIKFTCSEDDCRKVFETYDSFRCHLRGHYRPFTCKKCKTYLHNKENYLRHRNSSESCITVPNLNYPTLSCNTCCKTYSSTETLSKHVCGQKYFCCPKCKRQCTNVGRLVSHAFKCLTAHVLQDSINEPQEQHSIINDPLEEDGEQRRSRRTLFTCECSKTFSNENQLEIHKMKEHILLDVPAVNEPKHSQPPPLPPMRTPTSNVLVIRRNIDRFASNSFSNTGSNLWCKICRRRFQSNQKLRRHLQAHLSIKLYKCHLCFKSLSCEDSLQKHFSLMHGIFFPKKYIMKNNICQKTNRIYENYLQENNLIPDRKMNQQQQLQHQQQQMEEGEELMVEDDLDEDGLFHQQPMSIGMKSNAQQKFSCKICQRVFFDEDLLNGHIKAVHSTVRTFKCSLCPKSFSNPKHLYQHNKIHRGKRLYTCQVCMTRFLTPVQLRRHREEKHILCDHFPCIRCNNETVFSNEQEWLEHQNVHPKTRHFGCPLCLKVFLNTDLLAEHRKTHLFLKLYNCSACKNSYNTLTALAKHKRICLLSNQELQQQQQVEIARGSNIQLEMMQGHEVDDDGSYECNICYRVFKQMKHLSEHMRVHQTSDLQQQQQQQQRSMFVEPPPLQVGVKQRPSSYECNICHRVFNRRYNYVEHMGAHQRRLGQDPKPVGKKKHKCHICSKTFSRTQHLSSHLRAHQRQLLRDQATKFNEEQPNTDQVANDESPPAPTTATTSVLQQQLQRDPLMSTKTEFKCPICAKTFDQEVKMKLHKNYHFRSSSTIKNIGNMYTCQLCGQNFTSKANLQNHRNYCQEVFKTKTMPSRAAKGSGRSSSPSGTPSSTTSSAPSPQNQINNIDSSTMDPVSPKNEISNSSLYQEDVFSCDKCPREFLNKKALATHRTKAHVNKAQVQAQRPAGVSYGCHICSRQYTLECNLKRHIVNSHGQKGLNLNQSMWAYGGAPSTSAAAPRRHTMPSTSNSYNPHQTMRDDVFLVDDDDDDDMMQFGYNELLLEQDMLEQEDEMMQPPTLQPQMPPPPPLQPNPQQQARIKSEDFPFQCQICQRRFKLKEYLVAHFRMHTGERPYKCRFCPNTFARSALVYKHCLKHHAQEYDHFKRQKMMNM